MRTYVITGSGSGIGAATRELLEAHGDRVIGVDLRNSEVVADLSTPNGRQHMLREVEALVDVLDGVIACAGVSGGQNSSDLIISLNYFGAVATLQGLRPLLAKSDKPRAAVVSSVALLRGNDDHLVQRCLDMDEPGALEAGRSGQGRYPYEGAKRALAYWIRRNAVTADWAGEGISLNAVAPGIIDTPLAAYMLGDTEAQKATLNRVPQPLGVGKASDVASLLAWLSGRGNGFVTGQTIFVDGGHEALTGPSTLPRHAAITSSPSAPLRA